jgi:hypothetical protein
MTDISQEMNTDAASTADPDQAGAASATPEPSQESDQAGKPNREARYRTERNQAREQLAAAQKRIEALQTAEVRRLASDLAEPDDLFALTGTSLSDYLTNDEVDPELVRDAVAAVLATRPGLRKRDAAVDPSQGGNGRPPAKGQPTWGNLLNPFT